MKVYVFNGPKEAYGFTQNKAGSNLPADIGPWVYFKKIDMNAGETSMVGVNTDQALADITEKGYHVTKAGVRFSESET